MNTSKPGIKTTEFWLSLGLHVLNVLGVVSGVLPPQYAVAASTVVHLGYSVARGLSKHGANELDIPAGTTPTDAVVEQLTAALAPMLKEFADDQPEKARAAHFVGGPGTVNQGQDEATADGTATTAAGGATGA